MRRVLALACVSLAPLANASALWQCTLSDDLTRLHCTANAADGEVAAHVGATAPVRPAQVRGTRFPLDPRRTWTVEMWSPADDGAFVEQLARATICYRTPRCEVQVDLRPLARRDAVASSSR